MLIFFSTKVFLRSDVAYLVPMIKYNFRSPPHSIPPHLERQRSSTWFLNLFLLCDPLVCFIFCFCICLTLGITFRGFASYWLRCLNSFAGSCLPSHEWEHYSTPSTGFYVSLLPEPFVPCTLSVTFVECIISAAELLLALSIEWDYVSETFLPAFPPLLFKIILWSG